MPTPQQLPANGIPSQDLTRDKLVEIACAGWISRLIDLSRRNNLLLYRPIQSGTIEIADGSAAPPFENQKSK